MLTIGFFPDKLKLAKVVPLYKKVTIHFFSNCRPISVPPSLSKIFDKMLTHNSMPILKVRNYSIVVNMALDKDIQPN